MDPLILKIVVSLAPAPALLLLFAFLDVFRLMSVKEVVFLLLLGSVSSWVVFPVAGGLLDTLPIGFSSYSRFVAPVVEELAKAACVAGLFAANRIGFKLDAAISGFAVGVGFAAVENIIYLERYSELSFGVWLVRGFGTAVMHGGATALFAVITHELLERGTRGHAAQWKWQPHLYLPGLAVAIATHLAFNQFPDQPLIAMVGSFVTLPLTLLLVFRFGEAESREWLSEDRAQHAAHLAKLEAEGFSGDEAGPIRDALQHRFHGRVPPDIVDEYVLLHTRLILRAEDYLHGRASGTADGVTDGDRAAIDRFHALRRELGKAVLAALAPSLPFTRNDLWELRELEEDVRKAAVDRHST
jgi:RsiW-degrading membrane proteinase PrsW (M82 family)